MTFHVGDRPTPAQHAVMIEIGIAEEEFFDALDRIAPEGIQSDEWGAMVEHATSGAIGYRDWLAETWEPVQQSSDWCTDA